jgi:two-component system chemotaxis response regulator CheB
MKKIEKVRVLIVDDSIVVREIIKELLSNDKEIEVIGEAENGKVAIEKVKETNPDIVLMDIMMPVMDGLEATKRIMEIHPVPILIMSSLIEDPPSGKFTFKAINSGAIDVLKKPKRILEGIEEGVKKQIIEKVKYIARTGVFKIERVKKVFTVSGGKKKILLIGASAGGPRAVLTVLKGLKRDFPCPIIVAQHMAPDFVEGFSKWLQEETHFNVSLVGNREILRPGVVYVPCGGCNGVVKEGEIISEKSNNPMEITPSVDVLFNSASRYFGDGCVGVILSGIGKDGAEGAREILRVGGLVLAQDESSSTVYGMPRAAVEIGGVKTVLPLSEIPDYLNSIF